MRGNEEVDRKNNTLELRDLLSKEAWHRPDSYKVVEFFLNTRATGLPDWATGTFQSQNSAYLKEWCIL